MKKFLHVSKGASEKVSSYIEDLNVIILFVIYNISKLIGILIDYP